MDDTCGKIEADLLVRSWLSGAYYRNPKATRACYPTLSGMKHIKVIDTLVEHTYVNDTVGARSSWLETNGMNGSVLH